GQRGEKRADGAEQFCGVDFSADRGLGLALRSLKSQRRGVNPEIKPDRTANHHQDQKTLRGECRDAGADMGADEQPACRSGHRKSEAFQNMGEFSYAGLHIAAPQPPGASYGFLPPCGSRVDTAFDMPAFGCDWSLASSPRPV